MRSRCKDSSDFRPQAFPYGHRMPHKCNCAFTYRSQQKGENPVTRDYYQLTHEIRQPRGSDGARRDSQRSGAVFYQIEAELVHRVLSCLASPPDKHQGKFSQCLRFENITCKFYYTKVILVFHNQYSYFKFTHMKYLYSTELFQRLPFPPALCLLHQDQIQCFYQCAAVFSAHQALL